jgi:Flp pilus assembly protein TadD
MANVLDSLGRTAEAVESCKRALTINPGNAEAHFNLGVLARGRHEEAADSLRRAVEIKPDFAKAHHSLGTVLSSLGQLDAAEESLSRALSRECSTAIRSACSRVRRHWGPRMPSPTAPRALQFTNNDSQIRVVLRPQSHSD